MSQEAKNPLCPKTEAERDELRRRLEVSEAETTLWKTRINAEQERLRGLLADTRAERDNWEAKWRGAWERAEVAERRVYALEGGGTRGALQALLRALVRGRPLFWTEHVLVELESASETDGFVARSGVTMVLDAEDFAKLMAFGLEDVSEPRCPNCNGPQGTYTHCLDPFHA